MDSCNVCMYQCGHMSFPVCILVFLQCSQHFQERLVETFNLSIAHGVVGVVLDFWMPANSQSFNDIALKVMTLFTVQSGWKAILHNKLVKKKHEQLSLPFDSSLEWPGYTC